MVFALVVAVALGLFGASGGFFATELPASHNTNIDITETEDGLFIDYDGPPADDGTIIVRGPDGNESDVTPPPDPDGKTAALELIQEYAETDGDSEQPEVETYDDLGVVGVDEDLLDDVNDAIAEEDASDLQTREDVQDVVDRILDEDDNDDTEETESPPYEGEVCDAFGDDIEGEEVEVIYEDDDGQELLETIEVPEGACSSDTPNDDDPDGDAGGTGEVGITLE